MNFDEYQQKAARTWGKAADVTAHGGYDKSDGAFEALFENLREDGATEAALEKVQGIADRLNISALANGITGEAGEVADEIKKYVGHGHWKAGVDLEKEIGDVLWYAAAIAECMGFSLDDIAEKNIAKLEQRYKAGFSTQGSIDREDLEDGGEDSRAFRGSRFREQDPGSLKFDSLPQLCRFLERMESLGATVWEADDPSVPTLGWSIFFEGEGVEEDALNVEILIEDTRGTPDSALFNRFRSSPYIRKDLA